jgi:hypothetical protein
MPKTQAQKKAQKRYDAKNPKFIYRSSGDRALDLQAVRRRFESDQEMMDYLIGLGLEVHGYKIIKE